MAIVRPRIADGSEPTHRVEFITLTGAFQRLVNTQREITRPGVDGHAFRLEGKRFEPAAFIAIRDVTLADASYWMQAVAELTGVLCSVRDEFGVTYGNVLLRHQEIIEDRRLGAAVGGISTAGPSQRLITWRLTLQLTQVPSPFNW